jgi:hypothetical protein
MDIRPTHMSILKGATVEHCQQRNMNKSCGIVAISRLGDLNPHPEYT